MIFFISIILIILMHSLLAVSAEIILKINDHKSQKGFIHIAIYNDDKKFPEDEGKFIGLKKQIKYVIDEGIKIKNLPKGEYAIAIYHDQNENGKFDTFFGIPEEKYGFSNDAAVFFGPPSFNEASFNLDESESKIMEIRLR